ncbi:MAG: Ig-like domain-containing protein [Phycisphaerales bacterium]|nr:Ig-like domain-containing protein [Phycisphaerales bacterium]
MARALAILAASTVVYADPEVVPVGAGSYATYPIEEEGDGPVTMLNKTIYVTESAPFPIPTNDWWTDLLVSQYAGAMWAYPLTVQANAEGLQIYHPTQFSADGSQMMLQSPLQIRGEVTPNPAPDDVLIADFEGETYPAGWVTTGTAFGSGPAPGTFPNQLTVTGYIGRGLVNSYLGGDAATGTLRSPPFEVTNDYLHFLVAGGQHPDETEVRLLVDGSVVRSAVGENSESLDWHTWDVSDLNTQGAMAQIEIIDLSGGGWGHINADQFFMSNQGTDPGSVYDSTFAPVDARADTWSDWLVRFRLAHDANRAMNVTIGHGFPFAWIECAGVEPRITTSAAAQYFNSNSAPANFPFVGDNVGITYDGRYYGVYAPENTEFDVSGDTLFVSFAGTNSYLAVAALPAASDLGTLADYAYAIPRNTRMDWSYDPANASVTTTWTIEADALRGTNTDVIQGWLPHHYRGTTHALNFNGLEYRTPRGILKYTSGNSYSITYPFAGILPNLPAPTRLGNVANDFDPDRMDLYLTLYSSTTSYGADTYWGGKDLVRMGRYMLFAKESGDANARDALKTSLRTALEDWYTYTPGEIEHYFARYPNWGALVGFNESYYSFEFTDHHFHYGYYTMASALLAMCDPDFLADYGAMAKLVAKEYANWDRNDPDFPFLRTFDPWNGHSYAGGLSSPGGNNQESSSEAMQSWAGLFLLGTMLGDEEMAAAGAMGHALESNAINEYWLDYYAYVDGTGNFADEYDHDITGILFDSGQGYATYFTGDPAWMSGIQWLPISPALNYLAKDPVFAQWQFDSMMAERDDWVAAEELGENTIASMGTSLGNVVLGYVQLFNPGWVAAQFDALWNAEDPIARENYTGGITYYFTHANRLLGDVQWNCHTDMSTSQVYYNSDRDEWSYVVYNPSEEHALTRVICDGSTVGFVHAPPRTLTRATALLVPGAAFEVLGTSPVDEEAAAPADLTEVAVVFSHPVDVVSLAGATITGPGVTSLAQTPTSDDRLVVFTIEGAVQSGETYAVSLPSTIQSTANVALGQEYAFEFTIATADAEDAIPPLIAHYRLDESAGPTAVDSSSSHLDGMYIGTPAFSQSGAASETATSVAFAGSGESIELGSPLTLSKLINDFSVAMWIKPTVAGGNRVIFGASWHDYNGWSLRLTGDQLTLERLGPSQLYNSGVTIPLNTWTHIAAVYDASNDVTFYVNGAPIATIAGDHPASLATEPWYIAGNGTGDDFVGNIDDVQVYGRGITATDVAYLFAHPGGTLADLKADLDTDGDIDVHDAIILINCMTGPDQGVTTGCKAADIDADDDVDLQDVAKFQGRF